MDSDRTAPTVGTGTAGAAGGAAGTAAALAAAGAWGVTASGARVDADLAGLLGEFAEVTERVVAAVTSGGGRVGMGVAGGLLGVADRAVAAAVGVLGRVSFQGVRVDEGVGPGSYLRMQAGCTARDQRMLENAAERLGDMPALLGWFLAGAVSWAAVRGIVCAVAPLDRDQRRWVDATLAANAGRVLRLGADDLVGEVEVLVNRAREDLHKDREARDHGRRYAVMQPRLDGSGGSLYAELDGEGYDAVQTALDSYQPAAPTPADHDAHGDGDDHDGDGHDQDGGGGDGGVGPRQAIARGRGRRRGDALVAMATHRNADTCPANHQTCEPTCTCDTDTGGDLGRCDDLTAAGDDADAADETSGHEPGGGETGGPEHGGGGAGSGDGAGARGGGVPRGGWCHRCGRARRPRHRACACGGERGWAPTPATPTVVLRFDIDALAGNPGMTAICERLSRSIRGPVQITTAAAERILCDAGLGFVFTQGSTVLGATVAGGRIPAPLRRALTERDGGCRFPGCTVSAVQCDAHHIRHRIHDGPTVEGNLLLLCSQHHHAIHDGRWTITMQPDRAATFTRRGVTHTTLPRAGRRLHPIDPPPPRRTRRTDRMERKLRHDYNTRHDTTIPDHATAGAAAGAAVSGRPPPTSDPDPPLPF